MSFLCVVAFWSNTILAQYPHYFSYDDENGLPSNEVYSIVQDPEGFIWIGCDAGLYKFDGIRYKQFSSPTQRSSATTGLCVDKSGAVYCYNFQNQIFYVSNNKVVELKHSLTKVSEIAINSTDEILVAHQHGTATYNIKTKKWLLSKNKVGIPNPNETKLQQSNSAELKAVLEGRKINKVKSLRDGKIWICTVNGIVSYDAKRRKANLYYPDIAFSDCILDRENNYWFTALDNGLMRIPNLEYRVWNSNYTAFKNDKFTQIVSDGIQIIFTSVNGSVGVLNAYNFALKMYQVGTNADAQSLDYIKEDNAAYFNINKQLYRLNGGTPMIVDNEFLTLKSQIKTGESYLIATSFGTFEKKSSGTSVSLSSSWSREIALNKNKEIAFAATNDGMLLLENTPNGWKEKVMVNKGIQVLSVFFNEDDDLAYGITFDGSIFSTDGNGKVNLITRVQDQAVATKIVARSEELFLATNHGLRIWNLKNKKWTVYDKLSGLISDNIHDFQLLGNDVWIVTGQGLQLLKDLKVKDAVRPILYIRNCLVDKKKTKFGKVLELKHNQSLSVQPEVSSYSSGGNYHYAYRIKGKEVEWNVLPSTVEFINVPGIPDGDFVLEFKVIDQLGKDSNLVSIKGTVHAPLWRTTWFLVLVILVLVLLVFGVGRAIIQSVKRQERTKVDFIQTQLMAIRAQERTSGMFDGLKAIQEIIQHNDFRNSNLYLSKFSNLMRQLLDFSERDQVLISEEIEMIQRYVEMEQLRFDRDFKFELTVDPDLDIRRTFVPNMMIQPYIENAINHSLLSKVGRKELQMMFRKKSDAIEIVVIDNGIGRKQSDVLKQRCEDQEKIAKMKFKNVLEVRVTDLDAFQADTGTVVLIRIALQDT